MRNTLEPKMILMRAYDIQYDCERYRLLVGPETEREFGGLVEWIPVSSDDLSEVFQTYYEKAAALAKSKA